MEDYSTRSRGENRDVKYWSESNQHVSGDSLPAGYVSRYTETAYVSVRKNDLEDLKQIWEGLNRVYRQAFIDRYGDIAYLLYVQVNEPMLRALIKFWNPSYRCFTINGIDLMPTVEEYSELLRVPNIIEDRIYTKPKRNTNMPAQLAALTGRSEEWASKLISKKGENHCFPWCISPIYLAPIQTLSRKDITRNGDIRVSDLSQSPRSWRVGAAGVVLSYSMSGS
ncbi:hypothetical protein GQ457_02G021220 [Hibiscus cannabinus]